MQVISVFIAVLAVTSLVVAQSQTGYNYPSPFNPLSPGAPGELGVVQNAQQPTPFTGSQPGYNNQPFTPSGPQGPGFGATPTLTPGFNQPQFVPTSSSLPSSGVPSHSSVPSHSGVPSHSSVPGHSSIPSTGFGSPSQSGFPATSAPSSKGFESSGFPHSGSHSGGSHPGSGIGGTSFQSPAPGFPGSSADSGSGFGAPGFGGQGQQSFGAQGNNFGQSGSTQFQGENDGSYAGGDYSAIPGTPGQDYPIYTEIPKTSFDCKNQQFPGYYADIEAQCQVFHICALNTTFNFLCPNGTIFSQEHLVCVWWNQFDCNSAQSLYGNNAYIYDYSKTGQSQQDSQGPSRNFGSTADVGSGFDGAQGPGFGAQGGSPGFGATQPGFGSGSHSGSPGFGAQSPSGPSGFGPTSAAAPSFSSPSFGATQPGAPGFGSPHSSGPSGANIPSTGFGQPAPSHSSGFGQSHIPSSGSSHTSSHNIPSSHSFPSAQGGGGAEYPIVPPSQPDYQPSVIPPTIPSSPAPFGGVVPGSGPTGYPAAGTPTPINTVITGEQPSREYLPSRRTK